MTRLEYTRSRIGQQRGEEVEVSLGHGADPVAQVPSHCSPEDQSGDGRNGEEAKEQ